MVPLNETRLYTEDWIGLKAIDEVFISLNSFDRFTNPIITDHIIYRPHCCKPWYENLTLNFTSIWAIFPRLVSSICWRSPEITFSFRRWVKIYSLCAFAEALLQNSDSSIFLRTLSTWSSPPTSTTETEKCENKRRFDFFDYFFG